MDAALLWTIAGSVAGIAGAGLAFVQLVQPALQRRRAARATAPVRTRRWRWPAHDPLVANPTPPLTGRFVGRGDLLKQVRVALRQPRPVVLYGLGGVGKTQLALAYLAANRRRYQVVWWVRAEQPATMDSDLGALAKALRLPEADQADQVQAQAAVRTWLARNHGWLLVLDNARNTALTHLGPVGEHGRVLVTSRSQLWRDATVVWVGPWTPEESVAFLRASLAEVPDAGFEPDIAEQVAAELGHLPIALEQAVAYVRAAKRCLAAYLELLRTHPETLFALSDLPDDERTVAKTWAVALEEITTTDGAAELLAVCAYLAPDRIPRDLLHRGALELAAPLDAVAGDVVALDRAVIALRRYSFVEVTGETLGVHRLVQAVVRHRLDADADADADGERRWAGSAVRLVSAFFPQDADDVRTWEACEGLLAHGLAVAGHAQRLGVEPEATGRLLNEIGVYLRGRARFADARTQLEQALAIGEAALGPNHPTVATIRNNLGLVLWDLGDLAGARTQLEQALADGEAALGRDHPDVATRRSNLGSVLRDLGDLAGARTQLEQALAISEATLGPNHPTVATRRNNLALVLQDLGDLAGARAAYEQALAIDLAAYGPDHPNVATARNNLGSVLHDLGDLAGARAQLEQALAIDLAAYGPDHPNVATARNNLGLVLQGLGDLAGARAQLEQALAISEATLGPNHPDIATRRNNLALVLRDLGDLAGARAAYQRALAISEAVLGPDHPTVATIRRNMESLDTNVTR